MKKTYPTRKTYPVIAGVLTLWFIIAALIVSFATGIRNPGALFLLLMSILGIIVFRRTLRCRVWSDQEGICFRTPLREAMLPWQTITEIRTRRGKTGSYFVLTGKTSAGRVEKINLGILKNRDEVIRDIQANNPKVIIQ